MAKPILISTIRTFLLISVIWGCAEQNAKSDKDLTLPDFSFIGLSEPLADKQNIKVSVHIKIPYTELQFTREKSSYLARYEISVNITDKENERIAGQMWSDTLVLDAYQDTRKTENTIVTMRSFVVPASELTISVRVTDLYTRKSRIRSDGVDHSEMYVGELALGNIMLMEDHTTANKRLLIDQSFYEILDTLSFKVRLIGKHDPYQITYELTVKNDSKLKKNLVIDQVGAIDSLLAISVPLNDMHYTNYTLHLKAEDGDGNHVSTKTHFRVRIQGINFEVGDLSEAIGQLAYIADDRMIRDLLKENEADKMYKFKEFWASLDPTPGTPANELMDEYYRRVAFSIEAFSVVQDGWRTDRGMIYILFGPPDEIQRGPFEMNRKPYQIWEYYRISKQFIFVDKTGFGDYRLDHNYMDQNDWSFRY